MYTGIIKGRGLVRNVESKTGLSTITLELPDDLTLDLERGASVGVDGVCLTVTNIKEKLVDFDVMLESLSRTTLGALRIGHMVNIERSAKGGDEVGGHLTSGHVDCTGEILKIDRPENNHVLTFKMPRDFFKYIFPKGFIAINGASLTISNVDRNDCTFAVWLIPETLRITTFGMKEVGERVNIEIERTTQVLVDTTLNFLEEKFGRLDPQKILM